MNRKLLSPLSVLALAGFALVAAACENPVERECIAIANVTASTSGDTTITTSGLKYREIAVGTGAQAATIDQCQAVVVRYTGRVVGGAQFGAGDFPFYIGTYQSIEGFEQGVIGMRVGGRRQLIIPPALGYGSTPQYNNGTLVIPANSTLVFDLELISLETED
jgi:peptidylprolyl isomerase